VRERYEDKDHFDCDLEVEPLFCEDGCCRCECNLRYSHYYVKVGTMLISSRWSHSSVKTGAAGVNVRFGIRSIMLG